MSSKHVYTCDQCKAKTELLTCLPAWWRDLGRDIHACEGCDVCGSATVLFGQLISCTRPTRHKDKGINHCTVVDGKLILWSDYGPLRDDEGHAN